MYTQTVQDTANLFEGSPSDTPRHPSSHAPSVPGTGTTVAESQALSQTQIEAQTPTQAPRNGKTLFRAQALVPYAEYNAPATEGDVEVDATVPNRSPSASPETQDTELEAPSAAQPVRNAFDVLAMGARAAVAAPTVAAAPEERKKKAHNMFVQDEVEMDEEETAMMGGNESGDEDEAGMDEELESLVDNEEKDRDVVAEEDERVEELRAYVLLSS